MDNNFAFRASFAWSMQTKQASAPCVHPQSRWQASAEYIYMLSVSTTAMKIFASGERGFETDPIAFLCVGWVSLPLHVFVCVCVCPIVLLAHIVLLVVFTARATTVARTTPPATIARSTHLAVVGPQTGACLHRLAMKRFPIRVAFTLHFPLPFAPSPSWRRACSPPRDETLHSSRVLATHFPLLCFGLPEWRRGLLATVYRGAWSQACTCLAP